MNGVRVLPAGDPALEASIALAMAGGEPVAPLPDEPSAALAILRPEEPVAEEDAALIVATSGSTGAPKGVVLSRRAVRAAAEATHARLGGPGNWTLALPAHYVAGIMVIARAVVAGTTVLRAAPDLSDLSGKGVGAGPSGRHYLSLVPTQLVRALERTELAGRLACYDAILLGGAAADRRVLDRAAAAGIHVVTTYGMSETSGGCIYDGSPLDGVTVGLDTTGRVSISGPVVFSGYRLRPDLTREVLVGDTVRTQDRAVWVDQRLRVVGRFDDIVVSGGVNVDLATVERALKTIDPGAVALGVPDAEWGTRVVAATSTALTLAELRSRLAHLETPAQPRGLLRPPRLPLTASGKIDRQTLIAWWTAGPAERERL